MDFRKISMSLFFGVLFINTICYGQFYYKVIPEAPGTFAKIMISDDVNQIRSGVVCPTGATTCALLTFNNTNIKFHEYLLACLRKMDRISQTFQFVGNHYKFITDHSDGNEHHCLWELDFFEGTNEINIKITLMGSGRVAGKVGTILLTKTANRQEQLKVDYLVSLLIESIPHGDPQFNKDLCFKTDVNGIITELFVGSKGSGDIYCP